MFVFELFSINRILVLGLTSIISISSAYALGEKHTSIQEPCNEIAGTLSRGQSEKNSLPTIFNLLRTRNLDRRLGDPIKRIRAYATLSQLAIRSKNDLLYSHKDLGSDVDPQVIAQLAENTIMFLQERSHAAAQGASIATLNAGSFVPLLSAATYFQLRPEYTDLRSRILAAMIRETAPDAEPHQLEQLRDWLEAQP